MFGYVALNERWSDLKLRLLSYIKAITCTKILVVIVRSQANRLITIKITISRFKTLIVIGQFAYGLTITTKILVRVMVLTRPLTAQTRH